MTQFTADFDRGLQRIRDKSILAHQYQQIIPGDCALCGDDHQAMSLRLHMSVEAPKIDFDFFFFFGRRFLKKPSSKK